MQSVVVLAIWLIAAAPLMLWRAFVLIRLWEWFIIPTFPGAPMLGYPAAIGLSLTISFLTVDATVSRDHDLEAECMQFFMAVALPATALLIGWVVQHWMPQ